MSSSGQRFTTPAEVRAIPSEQWEVWVQNGTVPTERFVGADTRRTAYHVMRATRRRLEARRA